MRGAGTLRNIIGKPLYGKKKKQQQEEEADLHEAPAKKQKLRKASSIGMHVAIISLSLHVRLCSKPLTVLLQELQVLWGRGRSSTSSLWQLHLQQQQQAPAKTLW